MKVRVDLDRCIGSGMCTTYAPQLFELVEDGTHVRLLADEVPEGLETVVEDAVACCPVEAISTD
jgi:ferredoxin